ncbi:MAG: ACP S-malonyltransferase [Coriobacteriia bacterium]|nr:ACP S-malonyltransferase [Coriobacteriia bacterium]
MTARSALIFPGQGSQRPGMLDNVPDFDSLDRLLDAAEALSGLELRKIAAKGPVSALADTRVAQPLIYLVDIAWGFTLLDCGIRPSAVAGHSLGELAALAVAGVFSPEAGLELVVERSRLMASAAENNPGGMMAVLGLTASQASAAVAEIADIWIANDNAPGQVVISGRFAGLEEASPRLTEAGAKRVVPLAVAGPFHTPLMLGAQEAFADLLAGAQFNDARIPVVQNTDPVAETNAVRIRERLRAQITSPVRWTEAMVALLADGPTTVIESGPGTVLSGLARRVEGLTAFAVESSDLEIIVGEVA